MALVDDVALATAGSITALGLGTDGLTEVPASNGYVRLTPVYEASTADGTVDITNGPLQFNGPAGTNVTHLIFVAGTEDLYRALASPLTINSDGRVDITSAEVAATLA